MNAPRSAQFNRHLQYPHAHGAFLARNASSSVDADGVVGWFYETGGPNAAWVKLEPALLGQKLFYPQDTAHSPFIDAE